MINQKKNDLYIYLYMCIYMIYIHILIYVCVTINQKNMYILYIYTNYYM